MPSPPSIDALTHHLAQCPQEFLTAPRVGGHGVVQVDAVVHDVAKQLGYSPQLTELDAFNSIRAEERNWIATVLVGCWLAFHPTFRELDVGEKVFYWLLNDLRDVAKLIAAQQFVQHPDRREELARLMMHVLRLIPAGETPEQAADRLSTVNSVERARILRETRAQRERAEQLRREMAQKKAREAAAKYSRE